MTRDVIFAAHSPIDGWQAEPSHHYTAAELAAAWNVSVDFIRDLFRDETNVVRWNKSRPGKRRYVVMRVPAEVAQAVYRRAQGPPTRGG
jgi:hypothetical protein